MLGLLPPVDALAQELLKRAQAAGIPVRVTEGFRSPERQKQVLQAGTSLAEPGWSFHQYGLAFDVVPLAYISMKNWNPSGPLWTTLGEIGESLGLRWGGRFAPSVKLPDGDKPHFEYHPGFSITDLVNEVKRLSLTGLQAGQRLLGKAGGPGSVLVGAAGLGVLLWYLSQRA